MVYESQKLVFSRKLKTIRLACFSDIHIGSKEFARDHFRRWRDKHLKDKYAYFLGVGDMIEAIGPFDPRFTMDSIEPKMRIQALIDEQIKDCIRELEPIKSKLLGVCMGNHEFEILRRHGSDPTQRICEGLGVKNLGYSCLLHMTLRPDDLEMGKVGGSRIVKLYAHHGWGGGTRTLGGDMTKVSRKPSEVVADIFVFGHSHQGWEHPKARLDITSGGKPFSRDYLMVNTGTFKRGLSDGPIPTFEERMGYGPQKIGGRVIEIEVDTHKWVNLRKIE